MPNNDFLIQPDDLIQSPETYIQAAGSQGIDGSTKGIHLRWDFRNELGAKHLPKGDLGANISIGYNKQDDFVKIYKVPYTKKYPAELDFLNATFTQMPPTGYIKWKFVIDMFPITGINHTNIIYLYFFNTNLYNSIHDIVVQQNPNFTPYDIISLYNQLMIVEFCDTDSDSETIPPPSPLSSNLGFSVTIHTEIIDTTGTTQIESLSLNIKQNNNFDLESQLYISSRQTFNESFESLTSNPQLPVCNNTVFLQPENTTQHTIIAENIKYLRIKTTGTALRKITFESYRDFIDGTANSPDLNWSEISDYASSPGFALSQNDSVVSSRLDNTDLDIDGNWTRYNPLTTHPGTYKVRTANYLAKWNGTTDEEGLKNGVSAYIDFSNETNPLNLTGNEIVHIVSNDQTDQTNTVINNLAMLRLASLDYHIARMLGLGYIDADSVSNLGIGKYIYLMVYETESKFSFEPLDISRKHYYMTLPVSVFNEKTPEKPGINIEFGLTVQAGQTPGNVFWLTDTDGYMRTENSRFVKILKTYPIANLITINQTSPSDHFFSDNADFNVDSVAPLAFFGLEYMSPDSTDWNVPGLINEDDVTLVDTVIGSSPDTQIITEIVPLLNAADDNTPVYIHQQTFNGQYKYALYAINWFARTSELSTIAQVNTHFTPHYFLLPPSNLAVQLIQKEDPLILTSSSEQALLQTLLNNTGITDKTLVRITFDWNHNQIMAHNEVNKAQLFFREPLPDMVRGCIGALVYTPLQPEVTITAGNYTITSVSPPELITPTITSNPNKYVGSRLVSEDKSFIVKEVDISNGVKFKVALESTETFVNSGGGYNILANYDLPILGKLFTVIENMNNSDNWPVHVTAPDDINIISLTTNWELNENDGTYNQNTGTNIKHKEIINNSDETTRIVTAGGAFDKTKLTFCYDQNGTLIENTYNIEFESYSLVPHSGEPNVNWYRGIIRINYTNEYKEFDVIDINNSGLTLKLIVYDPAPLSPNPIIESTSFDTFVNFHPGYRIYLYVSTGFGEPNIMPQNNALSRFTLMGARSQDDILGVYSSFTTPVQLYARFIPTPQVPTITMPTDFVFATRPDFYRKSSYAIDIGVNTSGGHIPFAFIFYRANEQSILDALYLPSTVQIIRESIAAMQPYEAAFAFDRWKDLVNVNMDSTPFQFKIYPPSTDVPPGIFRFPLPDNLLNLGITNISQLTIGIIKNSILRTFLPLTEKPLLYANMLVDLPQNISKTKPVIRYGSSIRFADFTLDGASKNYYFYTACEMTYDFRLSDIPGILGPVRLINSCPPEAPATKSVISQMANPVNNEPVAVKMEINKYIESEEITKIQIYRALSFDNAQSLRTMDMVKEQAVSPTDAQWIITDNFSDIQYPPYGETLFYRLVAVRTIKNELGNPEDIISQHSEVILSNIIDVFNPEPPELSYTIGNIATNPDRLFGVHLKWHKTTHNATYYIYKMTPNGNWQMLLKDKTNNKVLTFDAGNLNKQDEDGNTIYHHYRVTVENASGLLNLYDKELTI